MRSIAIVGLMAAMSGALAQAGTEVQTIWRCTDSTGRTHVTNVKEETAGRECKAILTQRVSVIPAPAPASRPSAKAPAGFPKESPGDRSNARDRQIATLETELASEQALLAKAKTELAEQESIRGGDERNHAKVLERLQKYKDNVQLHQKNVGELQKELGKLK